MIFLLKFIFFSLSKVCRISSADCFISGFTASQSPQLRLRSIVGYTLLISLLFCFTFASKVFLYVIRRKVRLKNFFNLCLTSFLCLLHFVLLSVFALTSPRKTNYLSILYGHLQAVLRGAFSQKFFIPHLTKDTKFQKFGILKKNFFRNFLNVA